MSNLRQLHDELWRTIEAAHREQDHESANRAFESAEEIGRQILELNPNDAEACYAIALTWYHRWLPQSDHQKCLYWLQKAAEHDPNHPWVPLYLGYQYFDDQRYEDAFLDFSRVDQTYFESCELHWRNIKTNELILCCRVRGDFSTVDIESLRQLVSQYIEAEVIDRPIPTEIVKTLTIADCRTRFNVQPPAVAAEICRLLESIGDQNVFPEQLAELRAAAHGDVGGEMRGCDSN